jgi:hypothetical protein
MTAHKRSNKNIHNQSGSSACISHYKELTGSLHIPEKRLNGVAIHTFR